jgi:uncharacterized protein (TIGR03083 family)
MLKELESIANKLTEARVVLAQTLDPLTEEQAAQVMVTPEWSVKDVIAHLAGAERGMLGIAQRMARGEDPQLRPDYNNDTYNARQVAKRKGRSLADLRAELDGTRADMLSYLESLTPVQVDFLGQHPLAGEVTLKELLVIIYSHATTHRGEIATSVHASSK